MAQTVTLSITGMTCDHCVRSVTTAIRSVEGVTAATVSLAEHSAVVEGTEFDLQDLFDAIQEEGYEATIA